MPDGQTNWFDTISGRIQIVVTLTTAIVAGYVQWRQGVLEAQLKEKQQQFEIVTANRERANAYGAKLLEYVDKMKLQDGSDARRRTITIDVLDAITTAESNKSGVNEETRLQQMPIWLALSSGDEEGLQLIGCSDAKRNIWVKLTKNSGDLIVRRTAVRVMARCSSTKPFTSFESVYQLSDELYPEEYRTDALESMRRMIDVMRRRQDPALEPGDASMAPIKGRLGEVLTEIQVSMAKIDPEKNAPLIENLRAQEADLIHMLEILKVPATTVVISSAQAARSSSEPVRRNLDDLESDDTETRRKARDQLAQDLDSSTATALLGRLQDPKASYRTKLGVAVILQKSPEAVSVSSSRSVKTLVDLIGDDDATIRSNASEFLMKIDDRATVGMVRDELTRAIESRGNPGVSDNKVYNAAVILGTWARILPDDQKERREEIKGALRNYRVQLAKEPNWGRTVEVIDNLLALSERSK